MEDGVEERLSVLRPRQVCHLLGISRGSLHAKVRAGEFPKPLQLGERSIGWRQSDIRAWLDQRPRGFLAPLHEGVRCEAA